MTMPVPMQHPSVLIILLAISSGCTIALPPFISPTFPPGTDPAAALQSLKTFRIQSATLDLSRFDEFTYTRQYLQCIAVPGDVLEAHITNAGDGQYRFSATVQSPAGA